MSNIMQYLIQLSDESREYYEAINTRVDTILDKLSVIELRLLEVEQRVNQNHSNDHK